MTNASLDDRFHAQFDRLSTDTMWAAVIPACEEHFGPAEPDGDDPQDSPANPGFEVTDGDVDDYFEMLPAEAKLAIVEQLEARPAD